MAIKSFQGARKQKEKCSGKLPFRVCDFLKQISESRYYNMPMEKDTVEMRMSKDVDTLDGDMNVFDAANIFLESKHRRFPILEDGKLIGQISQKDILKAALEMKGHNWNSTIQ